MTALLSLPVLIGLIAVALAFDLLNGLHDTANSIATIVSTRMLRPRYAVVWAAFFNFIAFLLFGVHVARTIGVGIVSADVMDARVIFGALMGAISWNLITWWAGIPSIELACADRRAGRRRRHQGRPCLDRVARPADDQRLHRAVAAARLSSGAVFGAGGVLGLRARQSAGGGGHFQWLQFAAASLISLGHGGNDAQKTMGIIAVLLFSQGQLGAEFYVPFWVVITCQAAMGLGTLIGGWRIVNTVGSKITRMTPVQGCCASAGGAIMLFAATYLGIPVSTTHTVTGSIIGVGAARKASAVRWNIATNIVIAWIVTIPASALMAVLFYILSGLFSMTVTSAIESSER